MLFNSFPYFIFFLIVIPLYYVLKKQLHRILFVLAASCFFYMYFIPQFILILFFVIFIDYWSGIAIARQTKGFRKKAFLLVSIVSNLGILFVFKYFNFFIENAESLSGTDLFRLNLILPVGLSFHTFQSLSYVTEVYRGNQPAEKRIEVFALYVLFFPQLVAGPIERPQNIIHQLKEKKEFNYSAFLEGIRLIAMGLIKKSILADRLSIYVDGVFSNLSDSSSLAVLCAIIFFSLQIYFDFSGYSDMAIGSAKCLGIQLMTNFNAPYLAKSIKEFWTRWHISLSTWFKDYVFIPLGGNRVSKLNYLRNILIVFALSGLWHGASWNFIVWGLLHGLCVYISSHNRWHFERLTANLRFMDILFNFFIVTLLWVFFRSPDWHTTKLLFHKLLQFPEEGLSGTFIRSDFGVFSLIILAGSLLYLSLITFQAKNNKAFPDKKLSVVQLAFEFAVIFIFGIFNNQSFIYFQF